MSFNDVAPGGHPQSTVPAVDAESVDVSGQDQTLERASRALWVGGAGDLDVTFLGGTRVTLAGVAAGTLLPIMVTKVWDSATTATDIVALY